MIDQTNTRIGQMQVAIRRENERRNAFYRMLQATDNVLWRLEEMNRDGVKQLPPSDLDEIKQSLEAVPGPARRAFRDSGVVQEALDSVFEVQEALFRWRNPETPYEDMDDDAF